MKLTSVKVDDSEYIKFKMKAIENRTNFQYVVNTAIEFFNTSSKFRNIILKIDSLDDIGEMVMSGSY